MITDGEVLEYVQQLQAGQGDGQESCENDVSESLKAFFGEKYGSVQNFKQGKKAQGSATAGGKDGFTRLKKLRRALVALDRGGWERSYHQRTFHEHFITSVVRVLFKTDAPGSFERSYPRLLEMNTWQETYQEILISTPVPGLLYTVHATDCAAHATPACAG